MDKIKLTQAEKCKLWREKNPEKRKAYSDNYRKTKWPDYYKKNAERFKGKSRDWYYAHHPEAVEARKKYYSAHKEVLGKKARIYYSKHKEKWKLHGIKHKERVKEFKLLALNHYSKGKMCCACCGEKEVSFLCLDHIDGGGSKKKRERSSRGIYEWMMRQKAFSEKLQVLCYNCNAAKGAGPFCPVHGPIYE